MNNQVKTLLFLCFITTVPLFAQRKEDFKSYFRIANISYGDKKTDKLNQLDVYMPKKGSKSPVVIWVHGGYWISGDKSEADKKPEYFTSKGYIFIAVNYRLSPAVNYSAQVQDVANAIVWVYNNIIHYSGDNAKLFLMGDDTGAHLAAMVSVQDKFLKKASGSTSMIKGIVSVDGIGFYIPTLIPEQGNKFRDGCQQAIGNSKSLWVDASPVTHIKDENALPPILMACSGNNASSEADAKVMATKLSERNQKNKVLHYPKKSMNSINRDLGKEGDEVTRDIMGFLYECLQ